MSAVVYCPHCEDIHETHLPWSDESASRCYEEPPHGSQYLSPAEIALSEQIKALRNELAELRSDLIG